MLKIYSVPEKTWSLNTFLYNDSKTYDSHFFKPYVHLGKYDY